VHDRGSGDGYGGGKDELAEFCGKDRNTVRKWGYELARMGLLRIRPTRKLNPGVTRRPGYRNERNEFGLADFEARVAQEQEGWVKARRKSRRSARREEAE
jgi:hypothetical protein